MVQFVKRAFPGAMFVNGASFLGKLYPLLYDNKEYNIRYYNNILRETF